MVKFLLIIIAGGIVGFGVMSLRTNSLKKQISENTNASLAKNCVPTFVDGGGPYYQSNTPMRSELAPTVNSGEKLIVTGKVVEKDCVTPVANAIVDIWQANESGSYEDEWYRGRVPTNQSGEYTFTTVIPKGYGEGTGYRPPHIHFKIWQENSERITSQMFLPASREQGIEEAYIIKLETKEVSGMKINYGTHDIVLP
jgi:protocatechuate 3,4-dioxygenase beta subunit